MRRAIQDCRPDQIIFLGDGVRDAEAIEAEYPQIPIIILRGNCDWTVDGHKESALFKLDGVRIFAAHGHRHNVKIDRDAFWNSVVCSGSVLGLYGHTHRALIEEADGRYLMNPGSIGDLSSPGYGLVTINGGKAACELRKL